jgi:hypothetical protein
LHYKKLVYYVLLVHHVSAKLPVVTVGNIMMGNIPTTCPTPLRAHLAIASRGIKMVAGYRGPWDGPVNVMNSDRLREGTRKEG